MEKGIVPGGGVVLLGASIALRNLKLEGDEQFGVNNRASGLLGAGPASHPELQNGGDDGRREDQEQPGADLRLQRLY